MSDTRPRTTFMLALLLAMTPAGRAFADPEDADPEASAPLAGAEGPADPAGDEDAPSTQAPDGQATVAASAPEAAAPAGAAPASAAPAPSLLVVASEGEPAGPAPLARGVFVGGQVGFVMPLSGPLSARGAWGVEATLAAGLQLLEGLGVFGEVVATRHEDGDDWSYTTFGVGAGVRGTIMTEHALHPFAEAAGLIQLVSAGTNGGVVISGATATLGITMSAGLELDLSGVFSLELGIRPEFTFNGHLWSDAEESADNTFFLTPFVGASLYL